MACKISCILQCNCISKNVFITHKPIKELANFNINKLIATKEKFTMVYFHALDRIENFCFLKNEDTIKTSSAKEVEIFIQKKLLTYKFDVEQTDMDNIYEDIYGITADANYSMIENFIKARIKELAGLYRKIAFYDNLLNSIFNLASSQLIKSTYESINKPHRLQFTEMKTNLLNLDKKLHDIYNSMWDYGKYLVDCFKNSEIVLDKKFYETCNSMDYELREKIQKSRQIDTYPTENIKQNIKKFSDQLITIEMLIFKQTDYRDLSSNEQFIREYTYLYNLLLSDAKDDIIENRHLLNKFKKGDKTIDMRCESFIFLFICRYTMCIFFLDLSTQNNENIRGFEVIPGKVNEKMLEENRKKFNESLLPEVLQEIKDITGTWFFGIRISEDVFCPKIQIKMSKNKMPY